MTKRGSAVVVSISLSLLYVPAADAACRGISGRTLMANSTSEIVLGTKGRTKRLFACLRRQPARVLTHPSSFQRGTVLLAGRFAAYRLKGNPNFVVHNLATGRRQSFGPPHVAYAQQDREWGEKVDAVTDALLHPSGRLYLIAEWHEIGSTTHQFDVLAGSFDSDGLEGRVELLDRGSDIEPGSLALSRRAVYWTRGGSVRSASVS